MTGTAVTVVVPTLREAMNLPLLVARLALLRAEHDLDLEFLVMDDDSRDGSQEWAETSAPPWLTFVVRTRNQDLSLAVIDGIRRARNPNIVVMDADLSHPPESIPTMLQALDEGHDLVIGSRYVDGASVDKEWHWLRALNSRAATWLARPLTRIRDPMAGFLAFRRCLIENAGPLHPIGFKIGLELIVRCEVKHPAEIPIHFAARQAGESKLDLGEQLRYLRHLCRLYRYRFGLSRARPGSHLATKPPS